MIHIFYLLFLLTATTIHAAETTDNMTVVASIRPVHSLVSGVMKGVSQPKLLLNDQQSPHHPILKPSQINDLKKARIVFIIDSNFESFLKKPLKSIPTDTKVVSLMNNKNIKKLPYRTNSKWETSHDHDHDIGFDGHIWLNPLNGVAMVEEIAYILGEEDPTNKKQYDENAEELKQALYALDKETKTLLDPVKNIPFLVFHDGYQYFENRYHLNGQGSIVFEPNDPLKASRLKEIEKQIKTQNVICVFQDMPGNPRVIKLIETNFKINTQILDPLGLEFQPGPDLYFKLMRKMSHSILSCLSK